MPKAINIKWETDGYDVELPTEMEIPERFIDEDGIDEDAVSDWLSDETGWLHDGFTVVDDKDGHVTPEMKAMLQNLADLANRCSDEIWDDDDENGTAGILSLCDKLADKIDKYLDN